MVGLLRGVLPRLAVMVVAVLFGVVLARVSDAEDRP